MAEMIKCPVCGMDNPQGQKTCRNCQSPLSTGEGLDTIKSGAAPTKKQTAELEPILPQWLRDARDAARQPESQNPNETLGKSEKTRPVQSNDLLAGLTSQSSDDDEEEVPDWLANITGVQPKPKVEPEQPEVTGPRWVEMGGKDDFLREEPSEDAAEEAEMPAWLKGLQSSEPQPEKDELSDWFRATAEPEKPQPVTPPPAFEAPLPGVPADETPDWLRQMAIDADQKPAPDQPASSDLSVETPDWLSSLGATEEKSPSGESSVFFESGSDASEALTLQPMETPEWLKSPAESEKPVQDTTPKWLREEASKGASEAETPAWLASEDTIHISTEPQPEEFSQDDFIADLPDWLKAAAPQSSIFSQPEEQAQPAAPTPEAASDSPDWMKAFQSIDTPKREEAAPEFGGDTSFENAPAFTPEFNSGESDLFTEMPDWLSNAGEPAASEVFPASSSPTPITNEDVLAPSDLPSWVQAMRPVEPGVMPQLQSLSSDRTLESRGALAGLQGVLPAAPGFTPTSRPKAYSIKLQSSDEQLAHAGILEQILAAETSPVPLETMSSLGTSRGLRWFVAFLILAVVSLGVLLPNPLFSLPVRAPNEVVAVQNTFFLSQPIPQNAPVLLAFDYEPARAAELEAAATPMLDMLILFSHPTFKVVATNETGSLLAERLFSQPTFTDHFKNGGFAYSNLGYLPGGQMGIRAFAQDPIGTAPVDITSQPGWDPTVFANFESIGQFAAVILLTDNAEAARAWVEQTQDIRNVTPIPFVVVSSGQAAPMIEPYYDAGQVTGIIPGLYGGAIFEQYNANRPGTARSYWDAYSLGLLLAVMLMLGGGLWNLALGMRDRSAAKGTK